MIQIYLLIHLGATIGDSLDAETKSLDEVGFISFLIIN